MRGIGVGDTKEQKVIAGHDLGAQIRDEQQAGPIHAGQ